ncbi:MAG: leucine-rich repeat domain-containing protein, partial [Bacteroidales bacterium]|nr:leucine-rich repeat domain-containing protein [Bacteroidales bacterium]
VSIEESAFEMSDALKKISLPDSLTSLGESAFYGAELEELSLPDGIEEIPACCFCFNSIEKLKLPRNLKYVRACGLAGLYCDEVVLPEGTEIIESESIEGYYEKIFIPKSLREIAKDFYYEDGIDDYPESFRPYITVHPENPYFESHNGVLYKRGKKKRYL